MSDASWVATLPLALLMSIFGPRAIAAQGCYCRYAGGVDSPANATETMEPLWTCSSGVRQYQCLPGRWLVSGGEAADREAPHEYCTSVRAADTCSEPMPAAGFMLQRGDWRQTSQLEVRVMCPSYLNCSSATGFLSTSCDTGPDPNATVEEYRFVTAAAHTELLSPTHSDLFFAEAFGNYIMIDNDTIIVRNPALRKMWMYVQHENGAWNTTPTTLWYYPSTQDFPQIWAWSAEGFFYGKYKAPMPHAPPAHVRAAFDAADGQQAFLIPRSSDGVWRLGSEPPVVWGSKLWHPTSGSGSGINEYWSGFGVAVALSGDYAIVGSTEEERGVFIFERIGDTWQTDVVQRFYDASSAGFGQRVAIDRGGIAMVGAMGVSKVFVFSRSPSGTWSSAATLGPFSGHYNFPGRIAISGSYALIGAPGAGKALLFEQSSSGTWHLAAEWSNVGTAGSMTAAAIDVDDRGGGEACAVVGVRSERRALVFMRNATTGDWEAPVDLGTGDVPPPYGFGRTVGVAGDTIVVGSDSKKVYLYIVQLVGKVTRTAAVPLSGAPPSHSLFFDARWLQTEIDYTLCLDLDGDGPLEQFKDVGLYGLRIEQGPRLKYAEEL